MRGYATYGGLVEGGGLDNAVVKRGKVGHERAESHHHQRPLEHLVRPEVPQKRKTARELSGGQPGFVK